MINNPFTYNQQNPYLGQMANTITGQINDNLTRNIMPAISSGAQQVGGFGGSRQGVVESNALNDANKQAANALTGMYYGDYNNAMSRQLQKYGQDQNYNLGMAQNTTNRRGQDLNYQLGNRQTDVTARGQDLNYNLGMVNAGNTAQGQMMNFYTGNRQLDQSGMRLGMDMFNTGNAGTLAQGQGIYNLGLTGQQAPWQTVQNFNSSAQPYTGYGSTTQQQNGSAGAGFLGGAMGAAQMYNIFNPK